MKKTHKRLISLLLAFCLTFSMVWVSAPPASAGVGAKIGAAIAKKAVELGIRAACKVSTELAAQAEDDDASIVLQSFIGLILMDGQGVTVNKISAMCEDILAELAELEEDVKNYTSAITSAIDKQNTGNVKTQYQQKWQSDVTDVLMEHRVNDVLNQYVKYLIIAHLNTNGMPTGDKYDTLMAFWDEHYDDELDPSNEALDIAKAALEEAFLSIYDSSNPQESKDNAYKSAYIYNVMTGAIKELVYNYNHSDIGDNSYTVVDCAATDAYYVLPFSHQQYDYVNAAAKKQIMVVSMLEMGLNEYLSLQGQYLDAQYSGDRWSTMVGLTYTAESGEPSSITYEQCKDKYQGLLEDDLKAATKLLESDVRIDTTAYTGIAQDLTLNLSGYMRAEDATKVTLKIKGYAKKYDYEKEIAGTEADNGMQLGNTVSSVDHVTEELIFYRVMSGGQVYYILDPTQFSKDYALDVGYFKEHIIRYGPAGGYDIFYGDLYPVSNDYLNLIKPFSDGPNTFSVPSASEMSDSFAALVKVPSFSAYNGLLLEKHLAGYLPTGASRNTYILTSTYRNRFNVGTNTEVKSAEIDLVNAGSVLDNTYTFKADAINVKDVGYGNHKYTLILANDGKEYYQNANLKAVDPAGAVDELYFTVAGDSTKMEAGKTYSCKSGTKLVIRFKLDDVRVFDSLKMIRNNTEQAETVLVDDVNELSYLLNTENGYYEYECTMPYSNVSFVLETTTPGGDFLIENYEDLCQMAIDVNSGDGFYVNGTYTVVNDIDCSTGDYSARSIIGTSTVHFNGTFNGNGHTISNLNYGAVGQEGSMHGLFGVLDEDAVVRDLIVSNANVWSDSTIVQGSGVIAKQNYGLITSCLVIDSSIQLGNWANLGGIVGKNNGTISNCGIANSHLIRRWGGSTDGNMGGITEVNAGTVMNCYAYNCSYNNGSSDRGALVGSGNGVKNSYYYTESSVNTIGVKKDASAFTSGEVTYLLNSGVTDGTQVWYQDIDNGEPVDDYPVFTGGTVYKVDREDKTYSNYLYEERESVLEASGLRTYQRIILSDHTLSQKSQIAYGYGIVDHANKSITVFMADTAERMGVLMHQGKDGTAGIFTLMGDYPKLDKTSAEILAAGEEEPAIYTDGNGCIFIKSPAEGAQIPELTVSYTQKPTEDHDPTLYTLKVQVIDVDRFAQIGGTLTDTLDKDDPDYDVVHGADQEGESPETGDVSIAWFVAVVLCSSMIIMALAVIPKKKYMV